MRTLNVDEINSWCQFHQHFMRLFFDDILAPKNFKPKTQLCNVWLQNIGTKCARKMLIIITFIPTYDTIYLVQKNVGEIDCCQQLKKADHALNHSLPNFLLGPSPFSFINPKKIERK